MCINYCALNKLMMKNEYLLSRIQKMMNTINLMKYLLKINLLFKYWQIYMRQLFVQKTTFNTQWRKFKFLTMLFELINVSAIFQTMMNSILIFYNDWFCLVYLNDILIFSHTIKKHLKNLKKVLTALKKHKLYIKAFKCIFIITTLKFCDHIVEEERVHSMFTKINAITAWLCFKNVHKMCQFLKLISYYWHFIKHFVKIVVSLSNLLKKIDKALKKRKF